MRLVISKHKAEENICIILIALILFANIAIAKAKYLPIVILITLLGVLYCFILTTRYTSKTKKAFMGLPFLWFALFSCEMFLYGFFGKDKEAYSLQFHLFNIVQVIMLLIILYQRKEQLIETISKAFGMEIVMLSAFILFNEIEGITGMIFLGQYHKVGSSAVGNENSVVVAYLILIIPSLFQVVYKKRRKSLPVLILGVLFMFMTGSKKSIIAIVIMLLVIALYSSKNVNRLFKNILVFAFIVGGILCACYFIEPLNELIWSRVESMVTMLKDFSEGDQSSTGLRLSFIDMALKNAWDKPILGHGWNSFAELYGYSPLYQMNLYSHCNYTEVLFSFGLFGMFLYYGFPVFVTIRAAKCKNRDMKVLGLLLCITFFWIDVSSVVCYSNIIQFIGFAVVYVCVKREERLGMECETNG